MVQSTYPENPVDEPSTSGGCGLPADAWNFFRPLVAIPFEMARCSTERKLTQKNPPWRIIGHAREVLAQQTDDSPGAG